MDLVYFGCDGLYLGGQQCVGQRRRGTGPVSNSGQGGGWGTVVEREHALRKERIGMWRATERAPWKAKGKSQMRLTREWTERG